MLLLLQAGALILRAQPADAAGEPELRGVWVTRFQWQTAANLAEIVANVKAMGGNAIFFQVRGEADAYYRSRYDPWAARLTGTLGRDPGWDPLQVLIDRAHAAGLEVHAWLNTYSTWRETSPPPPSNPPHVLNAHPDWVAVDVAENRKPPGAEYIALSPGNPAVQQYIVDVVGDIVSRYAVDGIHLDYVRYSGRDFSYDAVSNRRLASQTDNPSRLSRADWQRGQVTELVRQVYAAIKAAQPRVQLSAAVWGVYRNLWGWPLSNTGYDSYYQDSRDWLQRGIVDFIVPMTYWRIGGMPDYAATVRDFLGASAGRGVYPGLGVYQSWASWSEVSAQIDFARRQGGRGVVLFSYGYALPFRSQLAAGPWSGFVTTPWAPAPSPTAVPPTPRPATPQPTPTQPKPTATQPPKPTSTLPPKPTPTAATAQAATAPGTLSPTPGALATAVGAITTATALPASPTPSGTPTALTTPSPTSVEPALSPTPRETPTETPKSTIVPVESGDSPGPATGSGASASLLPAGAAGLGVALTALGFYQRRRFRTLLDRVRGQNLPISPPSPR